MTFKDKLIEMEACYEAIKWVGDRDEQTAWAECECGDWMAWYWERKYPDRKRKRVLVAGLFANLVRDKMTDQRSRDAVDVAIAYGRGEATEEELRRAASAAEKAESAARAAARAASEAASSVAWAAASEAASAASAAWAAASEEAWAAVLKECAEICRENLEL